MGKSGPRRARVWKASLRPCRQCWPTCLCGPLCSQPFHAPHCRNSGKSWSLVVISDHTREDSLVPGTSQEQALWREAFSPTSTPATPGSPGTPAEAGPAWLTPHRGKDPPSSKTKSHFLPGLSSTNALCSIQAEKKHHIGNLGWDPAPLASVSPSLLPAVLPQHGLVSTSWVVLQGLLWVYPASSQDCVSPSARPEPFPQGACGRGRTLRRSRQQGGAGSGGSEGPSQGDL